MTALAFTLSNFAFAALAVRLVRSDGSELTPELDYHGKNTGNFLDC